MRPLNVLRLWLAALCLMSTTVIAEPLAYGVGFRDLYRLDLGSGQQTVIGSIGYNDVEGLAISSSGALYGAVDGSADVGVPGATDFLISINKQTGRGTQLGQLSGLAGAGPSGQLDYGLAFTCDQRLWLSSNATQQLWEVDRLNGAVRLVGNTGRSLSGLAGLGDKLYGVSVGDDASLYQVNRETGATTLVGPLGVGPPTENVGLDFDANGQLWAVLDPRDFRKPTRVARINLQTGAATIVSNINFDVGMKGLAIAPVAVCGSAPGSGFVATPAIVPSQGPLALWVMLLGTLGLAAWRLRH